MRVLLVKTPFARLLKNDVYLTYPIGLMYVASALSSSGHEVAIYHDDVSNPGPIPRGGVNFGEVGDFTITPDIISPYRRTVKTFKPDVVGFSVTTSDANVAYSFSLLTKSWGIPTVAGGIHPSIVPEECLRFFDRVVIGEGDIPEVEAAFDFNQTCEGNIFHSPGKDDLDKTPPLRDVVIQSKRYHPSLLGIIQTQRGCPYSCSFCSTPTVFGTKVRTRDPNLVGQEVMRLRLREGRIIDDSFGVKRDHSLAVCQSLQGRGYTWNCDAAINNLDEELLAAMKLAGCNRVNVGVESASPRWRELSGKKVEESDLVKLCDMTRRIGMGLVFYYMIGFPGETKSEIRSTISMASHYRSLGATPCISIVTPYPKTKLWDIAQEKGRLPPTKPFDWSGFIHQSTTMGMADCSSEEWRELTLQANRA